MGEGERVAGPRLSADEHKYDDVRGEAFLAQARRERRAYPRWVWEERATKPAPKTTQRTSSYLCSSALRNHPGLWGKSGLLEFLTFSASTSFRRACRMLRVGGVAGRPADMAKNSDACKARVKPSQTQSNQEGGRAKWRKSLISTINADISRFLNGYLEVGILGWGAVFGRLATSAE